MADRASVTVHVPDLCPRFTARVFDEVTIGPSPAWLQARLTAAGQRPINNVVDITNYVMLLTAQPLHAFDLDRVPDGALTVRTAEEGETMTTLDGEERRFDAETVLVCDENGPSGIAGIMGGQVSEVSGGDDQRPARGRQLERDQHPAHLAPARPALRGLLALREAAAPRPLHAGPADRVAADGRALRREARAGDDRRRRRAAAGRGELVLRGSRVSGLLGIEIPQADQVAYLERLGFGVEADGEDLKVDRAARSPLRRHPRGRPDRGGRPHPRPRREPALDPAGGRPARRAEPRAAPAPPGRGHDARPRLRRGRRLELHRPRRAGPAADPARRRPRQRNRRSPTRSPRTSR